MDLTRLTGGGPATRGADAATRLAILGRHALAFARHLTPRRLANFLLAEAERRLGARRARSLPYLLKIEPSNICNLRCGHCYDGRRAPGPGERPYGRMTLERFRTLLDAVPTLFKINLYGFGEPFLFPETLEMIACAAERDIGVAVSSNMHFDDPGLPERVVASGLEVLIVSCHGATPQTHARFMTGGDFGLAVANIRAVAEARRRAGSRWPLLDWQFCVTGFNEAEIPRARELARELGVDRFRVIRPWLPEDPGEGWEPAGVARMGRGAEDRAPGCAWLWRAAYVNWDGGVLPCCRDVRDMGNDFGNVFETLEGRADAVAAFRELWNNARFRAARGLAANRARARVGDEDEDVLCARCPAIKPVIPPATPGTPPGRDRR